MNQKKATTFKTPLVVMGIISILSLIAYALFGGQVTTLTLSLAVIAALLMMAGLISGALAWDYKPTVQRKFAFMLFFLSTFFSILTLILAYSLPPESLGAPLYFRTPPELPLTPD